MQCPSCGGYEFEHAPKCECGAVMCRSCAGESYMAGAGKTLCEFCLEQWMADNYDEDEESDYQDDYSVGA